MKERFSDDPRSCAARSSPGTWRGRVGARSIAMLAVLALWLNGCASIDRTVISLDGARVVDLSQVALVVEDTGHPLLLRGLDGVETDSMRVPSLISNYAYAITPGRHVFWVRDLPTGHPVLAAFERVRCYVIEAEVEKGVTYRLQEDTRRRIARLLVHDTGAEVAAGKLVDEPWVVARGCRWR